MKEPSDRAKIIVGGILNDRGISGSLHDPAHHATRVDAAIEEAVTSERERCARIAEKSYRGPGDIPRAMIGKDGYGGFCYAMEKIASEIRDPEGGTK